MKKSKISREKIIIVLAIIIAISFVLIGYRLLLEKSSTNTQSQKTEETNNFNIAESLKDDLEIKNIKITNISIDKIKDYYTMTFDMVNQTPKVSDMIIISFVFVDEKGKTIGTMEREFQPIAANEKISYEITVKDEKLLKAKKIKLEEVEFTE